MNFKRAMLLALVRQDMYPDDPEKKQKICDKYKEFIIPVRLVIKQHLLHEVMVKKNHFTRHVSKQFTY